MSGWKRALSKLVTIANLSEKGEFEKLAEFLFLPELGVLYTESSQQKWLDPLAAKPF